MSSEPNNAPREVWVRINKRGNPCGVTPFERETPRYPYGQLRYVQRDLVVPTVDEIATKIAPTILHSGVQRWQLTDAAKAVHALLLSRIGGADDAQ